MTPSPPSPPIRTRMSFIPNSLFQSSPNGRGLEVTMNKFFGRDCRGRTVPDRIGNLLGELLPDVANGKKTGDRSLHILISNDVAFFVLFQWIFHDPAIRGKTDINEETA